MTVSSSRSRFFVPALVGCLLASVLIGCESNDRLQRRSLQRPPSLGAADDDARRSSTGTSPNRRSVTPRDIRVDDSWTFAGSSGRAIDSPNYHIRTTLAGSTRSRTTQILPYFYERALAHYCTALAPLPEPNDVMTTYLFDNQAQWEAKTRQLLPDRAGTFRMLGRGGFSTDGTAVIWYIGRWDTLCIAAHEGWHQYTQSTFKQKLPVWLEEGVATYMEGFTMGRDGLPRFKPKANSERWSTLRQTVHRNELLDLEILLDSEPQRLLEAGKDKLLLYYAQVWALTRFLAEGENGRYRPAMREILQDAAHGRLVNRLVKSSNVGADERRYALKNEGRGTALVREYFNADFHAFNQQYRAYVDELVGFRTPERAAERGE